jgi:hypothetical protein
MGPAARSAAGFFDGEARAEVGGASAFMREDTSDESAKPQSASTLLTH